MSCYELPTSLNVAGTDYSIRSDFRAVLDIIRALNDPELEDEAKAVVLLGIMYDHAEAIPQEHLEEAMDKAVEFIEAGQGREEQNTNRPVLMDWDQDGSIIVSAINKVAGQEIRALPYLHWWTFIGYYMEIGECFFSTVLSIRSKKAKGEKLEKYETEFYRNNRNVIDLKRKAEKRSEEETNALRELFGFKKR